MRVFHGSGSIGNWYSPNIARVSSPLSDPMAYMELIASGYADSVWISFAVVKFSILTTVLPCFALVTTT